MTIGVLTVNILTLGMAVQTIGSAAIGSGIPMACNGEIFRSGIGRMFKLQGSPSRINYNFSLVQGNFRGFLRRFIRSRFLILAQQKAESREGAQAGIEDIGAISRAFGNVKHIAILQNRAGRKQRAFFGIEGHQLALHAARRLT